MPKVRSPRGTKTRFAPARVQSTISQAYGAAFGRDVAKWRKQIQDHSKRVIDLLGSRHGAGEDAEWTRSEIALAIEQEIRKTAPTEVHDAYLDLHPARRPRAVSWSHFEAKPESNQDEDPLWSIQRPSAPDQSTSTSEDRGVLSEMGDPARANGGPSKARVRKNTPHPCLRSDWLAFWRRLVSQANMPFDADAWEKALIKSSSEHMVKTPEEWWWFWQDVAEVALVGDPRCIELWRVMHQRRERARLCGQDWLDGSGLPGYEQSLLLIDDQPSGRALYRRLWQEHMHWWTQQPDAHPAWAQFDLARLAAIMEPQADNALGWASWQWLATCEGLWPIQLRVWKQVEAMPHQEAREPPQWAWMRMAMAMAIPEGEDRTQRAAEFYAALSDLRVVPSDAMLRESGKANPRFCEDSALMVRDRFESVQQAIHLAATETKWNGTIAIDWASVRSQGAPVGARRVSQGVPGFLRPIDLAQRALGRDGDERPVSVSLPVWHRDIEKFLDMRHEETPRMQVIVAMPDVFMQRLKAGEQWWILDPSDFPDLTTGGDEAYHRAVKQVEAHPTKYANTARSLAASTIWRKLLRASSQGSPFIAFTGALDASISKGPNTQLLTGLDGVGAFPISPANPDASQCQWPSMAVNLSSAVTEDGNPDLVKMRKAVETALRMLDNAFIQSAPWLSADTLHYRPVCLGAVGYYEAITRAMAHHAGDRKLLDSWVRAMGEGWAMVNAAADMALTKERGAAACFNKAPKLKPFAPQNYAQRLAGQREGAKALAWRPAHDWGGLQAGVEDHGQRFGVRSVWAPFEGAARIAGVTPGGLGTLRPYHWVLDERRQQRLVPSALLLQLIASHPDDRADLARALRTPEKPEKWPKILRNLAYPDMAEWNRRLLHASALSPWVDQGVSLTLPPGLPLPDLEHILHRAWMLGVANIRFEALDFAVEMGDDTPSPQ